MFAAYKGALVEMAPIYGIMIGFLYSHTDFEEGREYTIQCCILFISISVIWTNPPDGLI